MTKSSVAAFFVLAFLAGMFGRADNLSAASSEANDFPSRTVRVVSPFPPGGAVDLLARLVAEEMGEAWHQSVIVENRAGSGGMIGTEYVSKSAPDGYTVGFITFSHFVQQVLIADLHYNPVDDFTWISHFANLPMVICASLNSGLKTFNQMIEESKAGKSVTFGTSGVGTAAHLGMELVNQLTGAHLLHLPYRGAGPLTVDLLGGQITVGLLSIGSAVPLIQQGKVIPLAIGSLKRSPALPDVPTVAENLKQNIEIVEPYTIAGPKGIPDPIVDKLYEQIKRAGETKQAQEFFSQKLGIEFVSSSPKETTAFLEAGVAKWSDFAKRLGLKPN